MSVLKKYNQLIPLTVAAMDMNNEDLCKKVFETFNEFVEIKRVLGPHLPLIIQKALEVLEGGEDFSINLREVVIYFLELISENYCKTLIKNHGTAFVDKIIQVGFKVASEDPENYSGLEVKPPELALEMIQIFAFNVPNEKIYPILTKYIQAAGTSQEEHERAAATYVLGKIADPDACLDMVRDDLNSYVNFLVDRMQDSSFAVREASAETVGFFSEYVTGEFVDYHKKLMPCLLKVAKELGGNSKNDLVVQKMLYAINEFVQCLEYDLKIYLDELITILLGYAGASQFSRDVRYWALVAMASTILTAEKKITPYLKQLLEFFHSVITSQNNVEQQVMGQALTCAGRLAAACGKDVFPMQAIDIFT